MRIVFMGTPEFALPTLAMLLQEHEVVRVVTKPDRPKGRSQAIVMPPVKELALAHGVPVSQPERAGAADFIRELAQSRADLFVTCAYGKILPEAVLALPPCGCINVHASLLPAYRGAAPLWHAVIDGQAESGITTMMTDAGMDTGDILCVDRVPIPPDMTMGELHDVLAALGPKTLRRTLAQLQDGTLRRTKQDGDAATYAPMVDRETGHIDWTKSAREIHNLVRGVNPFPVAYALLQGGGRVKIWRTQVSEEDGVFGAPGEARVSRDALDVCCGRGMLRILEIQREGARKMTAGEYLHGRGSTQFA